MRKNIYSVHFCISLVTHQKRETGEKKQRDSGARVCVCEMGVLEREAG